MISRIDIEDMTDAQDEARAQALREAVAICKRVRAGECENDDQAIGALECALAIHDAITVSPSPRPSQAGDERVARLVQAAKRVAWVFPCLNQTETDAMGELEAALAAMDTPKGGEDE